MGLHQVRQNRRTQADTRAKKPGELAVPDTADRALKAFFKKQMSRVARIMARVARIIIHLVKPRTGRRRRPRIAIDDLASSRLC